MSEAEEYDKLTDGEKRIKIAELCGWGRLKVRQVDIDYDNYGEEWPIEDLSGQCPVKPDCIKVYDRVPDYLNDLNACHEFVSYMTPEQARRMDYHLHMLCAKLPKFVWQATSRQRCKAFVLTIELEVEK